MKKKLINDFISKYSLEGAVESVAWHTDDNKLVTKFISSDKSMMGKVIMNNNTTNLKSDKDIPIYETNVLSKLLNVLSDEISADLVVRGDKLTQIKFVDGNNIKIQFALADPSIIPNVPNMKYVPDNFGLKIKLTPDLVDAFIKAKSALPKVVLVAVNVNETENDLRAELILGDVDDDVNTNKIILPVETSSIEKMKKLYFSADIIKSAMAVNKDCPSAELEISSEGLARIVFENDDFSSTYYIVAKN